MDKKIEDAIRYISLEIKSNPDLDRAKLVEQACQKYDLDPIKSEFLMTRFILAH